LSGSKEVGEPINFGGMTYAPVNELGVVCLFGAISKMLGYHIERVHPHFPDCTARKQGKLVDIEFEFRASNAKVHFNNGNKCDVIVCWENDWPEKPKDLQIIELKKYVGCFRKIWLFSVSKDSWKKLDDQKTLTNWTCTRQSKEGDVVLWWRKTPESAIRDIWVIKSEVKMDSRLGCVADMKLIHRLRTPLSIEYIQQDENLSQSNFLKGNFQKRYEVTRYWADFYRLITKLNPELRKPLLKYFE